MKTMTKYIVLSLLLIAATVCSASAQTMARYSWDPPVIAETADPNTTILLSNDWTGFTQGYINDPEYDNQEKYWGYFDPNKYYSYSMSGKTGQFSPVDWTTSGYHPGGDYWSGRFLNWVTMANVDFLRKALTGGRRSVDATGNTLVQRALIQSGRAWKKSISNAGVLAGLVPPAYADTSYHFYNTGRVMRVRDKDNNTLAEFDIEIQVCTTAMPEENCQHYPTGGDGSYKPQGLLHKYAQKMRFALFTYSHGKEDAGGVLRKRMDYIDNEYSKQNGVENSGVDDSIILYINNYTEKGWDPLAEMYYEALRYLKGNPSASATADYCPTAKNGNYVTDDDGFTVYGCVSGNTKDWGADPIQNWCSSNHIIILNDEYPSRDHDQIPNTVLASYTHSKAFNDGNSNEYLPDVAELTRRVGEHEGIHASGTKWEVGNVEGGGVANDTCGPGTEKAVHNLAYAHGMCPTEPTSDGTFYLAGLAYDAFAGAGDLNHDFRPDLTDGPQAITTWALAYRASSGPYQPPVPPMNQMWLAAKYGNFDDSINTNAKPDPGEWEDFGRCIWRDKDTDEIKKIDTCREEWIGDKNIDTTLYPNAPSTMYVRDIYDVHPRGYFPADRGDALYDALDNIFSSILETTASSTAVSVLANSGEGEGNLVQAYYRPRKTVGGSSVSWIGFLQSLWIDEFGFIREDTGGTDTDRSLDPATDRIIRFVEENGVTQVRRYAVSSDEPYPDLATGSYDTIELDQVEVLFDAGRKLSETDPVNRRIFTFIDRNNNQVVDDTSDDVFDEEGEVLKFYDRNYRDLMPYLNVLDADYLGRSQKIRAINLVRWVQGYDEYVNPRKFIDLLNVDTRPRSLDGKNVFKLGDIVNSTPVTVAAPPDNYHIIYSDESYQNFYTHYTVTDPRETVVYVGANDGMLHAFTSWEYDKDTQAFIDPAASASPHFGFGEELWAYIPQSLLPHLKWLPRDDYSHVYYVDMQPRIFDARIFMDDVGNIDDPAKHIDGWGTILVGGFGLGGGSITVADDFKDGTGLPRVFKPTYFAIDITDPRNPELLWERSFDGLGMSYVYPTIMRVGPDSNQANFSSDPGEWFLVFGSGPDDGGRTMSTPQYDGESEDPGYVYVVDIKTGQPHSDTGFDWQFATAEDNAFMGPPVSYDHNLNYNTDAAYIPFTNDVTAGAKDWDGGIYKITTPWKGSPTDTNYGSLSVASYSDDPVDATFPWQFHLLFDASRPISASPSLSIDGLGNTWVYAGTGRIFDANAEDPDSDYFSQEDEFLYGIKDPFFNSDYSGSYYLSYLSNLTLTEADLFDADPFLVLNTGQVYKEDSFGIYQPYKYFDLLVQEDARPEDGWKRTLHSDTTAGTYMRSLNKPTIIGGLSLFSTFMPTGQACRFGGESAIYILYYETGTAFKRAVARGGVGLKTVEVDGDNTTEEQQVKEFISLGSGSTSSVGIHIGRQNTRYEESGDDPEGDMVTGFVQQGTGNIVELDIETALKVRSGLRGWFEQ